MSLRLRLFIAGALAILAALGLAAFGLAALFSTHVERRALAEMSAQLDQVIAGLEIGPEGLGLATPPADPRFHRPYGGLYWQIETEAGLLRSRSLWDSRLSLPPDALDDGQAHRHILPGPDHSPLLVLERRVALPPALGGESIRAAVALDRSDLETAQSDFLADLAPYLALLATALIAAGAVQVAVGLRPLAALERQVGRLKHREARRMGQDWPGEVQPLASEIDALLDARDTEVTRARARAADLAHGLKTPLQALMGESGRLRAAGSDATADTIEDIAHVMQRTVDRELARARSAARPPDARAELARSVKGVVSVLRLTPKGAELEWHTDIPPGLFAALEESALAEALGALAENAARHACARVSITARRAAAELHLDITDDGPGIPPERRAALTGRFARADESGTGLGLAIASDIAEAAGGALRLGDAGPGLRATLVLPLGPENPPAG